MISTKPTYQLYIPLSWIILERYLWLLCYCNWKQNHIIKADISCDKMSYDIFSLVTDSVGLVARIYIQVTYLVDYVSIWHMKTHEYNS